MIAVVPVAAATTWTVGANGCDFITLMDAINSASVTDGDTISVNSGTYAFTGLTKSLTLTGMSADLVTLDMGNAAVAITGRGTIFERFRFTNGLMIFPTTSPGATNMIIRDCIFENMKDPGTAAGAVTLYGDHNTITGCMFKNNAVYNLVYVAGNNHLIEKNNFTDTTSSAPLKGVIRLATGSGHVIRYNAFADNAMPCILLQRSMDAGVYLNNFVVPDGYVPIKIQGTITPAAFSWNTPLAVPYTYHGASYTKILGNYYNTYTGADTDRDGIGDTPCQLATNEVDTAPLMAPVGTYFALIANFSATPLTGKAPLTIQFTDASTSAEKLTYAWDFENDGVTDSTEQSPAFTYANPGTYDVNLTVTSSGGSNSEVKISYITVTMADITAKKSTAAPEFPTMAFPAAFIAGMLGVVLFIRRTKEN